MKLCRYSSERFAGTSGVNISFEDGVNVILGNNESGKSTLIEGMFRAFKTSVYLDKRRDKAFISDFFPTDGGNVIDSKIVFSDGGKEYELSKIWVSGKSGQSVSFKETDGRKMTGEEAEMWLSEVLKYGEGIYSNVIFGRQNNEAEILEWLCSFLNNGTDNGKEEAKRVISESISAAGGISLDKLRELLDSEIAARESNWDTERDAPIRKGAKKGAGTIYRKYTEYSEALENVENARKVISELEECMARLRENKTKSEKLKILIDEYSSKKSSAQSKAEAVKSAEMEAKQFRDNSGALKKWSEAEGLLAEAEPLYGAEKILDGRRKYAELEARISSVRNILSEINRDKEFISPLGKLPDDLKTAKQLDKRIDGNKLRLSMGKLRAQIKMLPPYTAEVKHAEGSAEVSDSVGIDARGFVCVSIPNVAEITVSPENVNVAETETAISADTKELGKILDRYSANTADELEALKNEYDAKNHNIGKNTVMLEGRLGGHTLDELESELAGMNVSDAEIPEDFEEQKKSVLRRAGAATLEECIGKCRSQIQVYSEQYGSMSALREETEKYRGAEERLNELKNDDGMSPEELGAKIAGLEAEAENILNENAKLQRELGRLESCDTDDISELEEKAEAAKRELEKTKREWKLYRKIRGDLITLRKCAGDSFKGFYDKFNEYLSEISGGSISASEDNGFESKSARLSGSLLSEGTKKTVTLAFRLAVLDFFFPDGGGFAVLDDALMDMDPDRRERSARLIKKFAEKNQVIITTCDPSVAGLLCREVIRV